MSENSNPSDSHSVFFTKQPILDSKRSIWGYELLGGEMREGIYEVFPQQESAANLTSSTYWGLQEAMERGKKIIVGLDEASVLTGVPRAMPPSSGVVRVLPGATFASELPSALRSLRKEGYMTIVGVASQIAIPEEICVQTDIFSFDLSAGNPAPALLNSIVRFPARMLARGVKTMDQFQAARDLGFELFQGAFFKEPEYVRDRKFASSAVSRLNLMRLWECEDPDLREVASAISHDVAISFRLLTYLNSAHFGLRYNVESIDQAIMMLGWDKLKGWLRALIIVDIAGKNEGPQELAILSLQRGKFFELLATEYDYWGFNSGTLFLLGLFSLLDTILAMPMAAVVEMLPIEAKLKAALQRDPNNEYWPLFQLLDCLEEADWGALDVLTRNLCLDLGSIKVSFAQARDWASGFFAKHG
jgi:c-di-GMP phosphodiesterase